MASLAERIAEHAAARPEAPAVTCGDATATFGELAAGAARVASHLAEAGAGRGSMVALLLPNGIDFVEAMVATWWLGATPVPISPKLSPAERAGLIELAAPAVVLAPARDAARGQAVLTPEDLAAPGVHRSPSSEPSPQWKVICSGGSTGRPKLIVAEQPADVDAVAPLGELLRVPSHATLVVPGPLSHNAPFAMLTAGLMFGSHVVLMPRFDAAECLRLVEAHRARWLYQVPTMMLRIWRLPERERLARDVSSVDVVFHLAAPCPPWLKERWCDWIGAERIMELYAGTELQAATIVTGTEWLDHRGTVGRVQLGEMEVRDQGGARLPPGEIGEIWMRRAPDVPGPYRYIGATPRSAAHGWESLGDNGSFDEDGYLYLADRTTDMILVGGSNVYPAEIEAVLEAHPAVRSSCAIGLPDDELGNVPHALVELAEDVSDEELIAWTRERLAGYKAPRSVERVAEPLRDEAGKVRRGQLRAERLAV